MSMKAFGIVIVFLFASLHLQASSVPSKFKAVPERMLAFVDDGTVSGAVTLVAHKGEIVSLDAVGLADGDRMRPVEVVGTRTLQAELVRQRGRRAVGSNDLQTALLGVGHPDVTGRLVDGEEATVELDDLISAGVFGLMDAIDAFDLHRGVKFETYCVPRIRGAMLDELRTMDWVPRLVRRFRHSSRHSSMP